MDSSYWSLFVVLGEPTNIIDQYAVAVIRSGLVVGHLPKKISRVCSVFLRRGGTIYCIVTNTRRYSADLPQGGLEIPVATLHFEGINSLRRHLKNACPISIHNQYLNHLLKLYYKSYYRTAVF